MKFEYYLKLFLFSMESISSKRQIDLICLVLRAMREIPTEIKKWLQLRLASLKNKNILIENIAELEFLLNIPE